MYTEVISEKEIEKFLSELEAGVIPDDELFAIMKIEFCNGSIRNISTACLSKIIALPKLKKMDLSRNALNEIPSWIWEMTQLTHLNLNGNQLKVIPKEIGKLTELEVLSLKENALERLPIEMLNLTKLWLLEVDDNPELHGLPSWLANIPILRAIGAGNIGLTALPSWMVSMIHLQGLILDKNPLTELPEWFREMTHLNTLSVAGTKLRNLSVLRALPDLTKLDVSDNQLYELPEWFGELKGLKELYIRNNELESLPESLATLKELKSLDLENNYLEELPPWLPELTGLRKLDLSSNPLKELFAVLMKMSELNSIGLMGLTLPIIPESLVKQWRMKGLRYRDDSEVDFKQKGIFIYGTSIGDDKEMVFLDNNWREILKLYKTDPIPENAANSLSVQTGDQNSEVLKMPESVLDNLNAESVTLDDLILAEQPQSDVKIAQTQEMPLEKSQQSTKSDEKAIASAPSKGVEARETESKYQQFLKIYNIKKQELGLKKYINLSEKMDEKLIGAILRYNPLIITGAPGTGKTYSVLEIAEAFSDNQLKPFYVQFHPSYDYADFVEGLRPVNLAGKEEVTFVRMDGVFKEFCRKIVDHGEAKKKYFFIVDEINRADLSRVLGELMFGLEESYRGEKYRIHTQYENLTTYRILAEEDVNNEDHSEYRREDIGKAVPIKDDCFSKGFYIPDNLVFIGIMNEVDRSVESFDLALRRRFYWIRIKANEAMEQVLKRIYKENESLTEEKIRSIAGRIIDMNQELTHVHNSHFGFTEAYHIGPAYFKKLDRYGEDVQSALQEIFDHNIVPLIREYARGTSELGIGRLLQECAEKLQVEYKDTDDEDGDL